MVLVTGATGLLGRMVVLELLKRGKTVRATRKSSSDLDEVRSSYRFCEENADELFNQIEWFEVDFKDLGSLKRAVSEIDEVYHCAAVVSFHPRNRKETFETNVEGTKQLLYAVENSPVEKFLFISSIAVLDGENEAGLLDEDSEFNPKIHHSAYAESKHFAEMEVWRASAEGLNTIIVNPGIIIGSGGKSGSAQMFRVLEKLPFAMPGSTGYVDVRDVAKASVDLMENNSFGERFVLMAENKRYYEIAEKVRQVLGKSKPRILPKKLLQAAGAVGSLLGILIPKLRIANSTNIAALTNSAALSNKKIKNTLGYDFINIDESLEYHLQNYLKTKPQ